MKDHVKRLSALEIAKELLDRFGCELKIDTTEALRRFQQSIIGDGDMEEIEISEVLIRQSASLIVEEPDYGTLASRILLHKIENEVFNSLIHSFSDSITQSFEQGLLTEKAFNFVMANKLIFNQSIDKEFNQLFTYFGLATVYDRYLLRHPIKRHVLEIPQYAFLRIACGIYDDAEKAVELYRMMASF